MSVSFQMPEFSREITFSMGFSCEMWTEAWWREGIASPVEYLCISMTSIQQKNSFKDLSVVNIF